MAISEGDFEAYRKEWAFQEKQIEAADLEDYCVKWGERREAFYSEFGARNTDQISQARLKGLKGVYSGERIFILGNGPSLMKTPLHLLKDEYTFGVNRIYLLRDSLGWMPTFYTANDWRVVPDNAPEINALTGSTFFFDERFRGLLREGSDVYFYAHGNYGWDPKAAFSDDMSLGVAGAGSVVGSAIQIAAHLGFSEIFLLGCDLGYRVLGTVAQEGEDRFGNGVKLHLTSTADDDPNHFDARYFGKGKRWHDPNVKRMIEGHEACLKGAIQLGKQIFNATVGGELEVYPRVNIWEVLSMDQPPRHSRDDACCVDESAVVFELLDSDADDNFMIDVGAHHGHCTRPFAQAGWEVHCFEPDEENRRYLQKNVSGFSKVKIDPRAVSDHAAHGETFYRSQQSSGISGLLAFHESHENADSVSVTTLSEVFWDDTRHPRFLKIDVEGFDLNVLRGMPWDRMHPDVVLCEFEDAKTELLGHTYLDIADYLVGHGYTVYLSEWHPIVRYGVKHDWLGLKRYPCRTESKEAWGNLLAFAKDPGNEALQTLFENHCQSQGVASTRGAGGPKSDAPLKNVGQQQDKPSSARPVAQPAAMSVRFFRWTKHLSRRFWPVSFLVALVLATSLTGLIVTDGVTAEGFAGLFVFTLVAWTSAAVFGYLVSTVRTVARSSNDRWQQSERRIAALEQQVSRLAASLHAAEGKRTTALEARINAISEKLAPLESKLGKIEKSAAKVSQIVAVEAQLSSQEEKLSLLGGKLEDLAEATEAAQKISDYQPFSRLLEPSDLDELLQDWAPRLGLDINRRELVYIANRICSLESISLGRIATTIQNAVLRVLVALSLKDRNLEILEIGALFGLGAITLYDSLVGKSAEVKLTLIDPLDGYYDLKDVDHLTGESITRPTIERNLALCGVPESQYRILQGLSEQEGIIAEASNRTYSLLLIDGDHSREGVRRDFENYVGLVRLGGYILFDDYGAPEWDQITDYVDTEVLRDERVEFVASGFRTALFRKV